MAKIKISRCLMAFVSMCVAVFLFSPSKHGFSDNLHLENPPSNGYGRLIVASSAKGWNLRLSKKDDIFSSNLLINPEGKEFNIGPTLLFHCPKTILWIVNVPKLNERFLVIYFHPVASGAMPMYLFSLNKNNIPTLSAKIYQHYELDADDMNNDFMKKLFVDCNDDGIPELKDDNVDRWGGNITFYKWVKKEKIFKPTLVESYTQDTTGNSPYKFVSREKVKHEKTRGELIREWSKSTKEDLGEP